MLHDVVWDIYPKDSLKLQNRQNRVVGNCLLLSGKTSIQINWENFQRVDTNMEGLFPLLAIAVQGFQQSTGKTMISTLGDHYKNYNENKKKPIRVFNSMPIMLPK